jgi:hypothetical protein
VLLLLLLLLLPLNAAVTVAAASVAAFEPSAKTMSDPHSAVWHPTNKARRAGLQNVQQCNVKCAGLSTEHPHPCGLDLNHNLPTAAAICKLYAAQMAIASIFPQAVFSPVVPRATQLSAKPPVITSTLESRC